MAGSVSFCFPFFLQGVAGMSTYRPCPLSSLPVLSWFSENTALKTTNTVGWQMCPPSCLCSGVHDELSCGSKLLFLGKAPSLFVYFCYKYCCWCGAFLFHCCLLSVIVISAQGLCLWSALTRRGGGRGSSLFGPVFGQTTSPFSLFLKIIIFLASKIDCNV